MPSSERHVLYLQEYVGSACLSILSLYDWLLVVLLSSQSSTVLAGRTLKYFETFLTVVQE